MAAEAERIDLFLTERLPRWRVREALDGGRCRIGWSLVDLEDVWLGGPALGGIVAAADYRITLEGDVDAAALADACRALLGARTLPRQREKGGGQVAYDLRPLLVDVAVDRRRAAGRRPDADPVPPDARHRAAGRGGRGARRRAGSAARPRRRSSASGSSSSASLSD